MDPSKIFWIYLRFRFHHACHVNTKDIIQATMKLATLLTTIFAVTTSAFSPISTSTHLNQASRSSTQLFSMPICIVVEAEIKEDRMDEFLDMIEKNAVGSRAEPGCIRFGTYGWLLFFVCGEVIAVLWWVFMGKSVLKKALKMVRKHTKNSLYLVIIMVMHGFALSI